MLAGGDAGQLSSITSLFVGLAALALAVADFFRAEPLPPDPAAYADDLARNVRIQWLDEAEARRLRDPGVLPLAWAETDRPVADRPAAGPGGQTSRRRLDGRIRRRFSDAMAQLASGYGRLTDGRLVVIGEPGAGKTVLAMLLTLGLLDARTPGAPVPVLLPVSSWDPVCERLDDWIVRTLAVPYYGGRPEIPRALLTHGLLLPVLDGLDEIPETARRGAVQGINQGIGTDRPVVVTCRAVEYEELIEGGAPRLRRAPVVEVLPLRPRDVIAHLREDRGPGPTPWEAVFDHLERFPHGPLGQALSTPLMVTTAQLVYHADGDPGELLDTTRFDCRYAVEDHLTHRLLDAAYADSSERGPARWDAGRARRWLTFLARYLHEHRERDLEWWRLSGRVLPVWAGLLQGVGFGLVLGGIIAVWLVLTEGLEGSAVLGWMMYSLAFGLVPAVIWYVMQEARPGRLVWSLRGAGQRLRREFLRGVVLCAWVVGPVAFGTTLFDLLSRHTVSSWRSSAEAWVTLLTLCLALCLVVGLALAVHAWFNAPPSRATRVSPRNSLAQDRMSSLFGALLSGVVVGGLGAFGLVAGLTAGGLVFRWVSGWPGWPAHGEEGDYLRYAWSMTDRQYGPGKLGMGATFLLPGLLFAYIVLLSRAWPRFLGSRLWLALRGDVPWRLFAFLADARGRGILRQSGSAYQFRHIRLQEALAGAPTYPATGGGDRTAARAVRRRAVLTAGAAAAIAGGGFLWTRRWDESVAVFSTPDGTTASAVAMRPRSTGLVWGDSNGRLWARNGRGERLPALPGWEGYDTGAGVLSMAFSRNGTRLAVGCEEGLLLWPGATRSFIKSASAPRFQLDFSPSGRYVAGFPRDSDDASMQSGDFSVWQVTGERAGLVRRGEPGREGDSEASVPGAALAFLPDGDLLALRGDRGRIVRYRSPEFTGRGGRSERVGGGIKGGAGAVFSRGGDLLYVVSGREEGALWRRDGGGTWLREDEAEIPTAYVLAFGRAGRLMALAAWSENQDPWASDGYPTLELWSTDPGEVRCVKKLRGHEEPVNCIDFSSDGRYVATASEDGTVRLWDLQDLNVPRRPPPRARRPASSAPPRPA